MAAAVAEKQLKQTPHGGKLVDLTLRKEDWEEAIDSCNTATELSDRGACDVELLANGYFTPHHMAKISIPLECQQTYKSMAEDSSTVNKSFRYTQHHSEMR